MPTNQLSLTGKVYQCNKTQALYYVEKIVYYLHNTELVIYIDTLGISRAMELQLFLDQHTYIKG